MSDNIVDLLNQHSKEIKESGSVLGASNAVRGLFDEWSDTMLIAAKEIEKLRDELDLLEQW